MSFKWKKYATKLSCLAIIVFAHSCQKKTQVYLHPVYDPNVTIDYRNQYAVTPSSPGIYAPNHPYAQPSYYPQQRPASRFYRNPYDFPSARYPNYDVEQYYQPPTNYYQGSDNDANSEREFERDLEHE